MIPAVGSRFLVFVWNEARGSHFLQVLEVESVIGAWVLANWHYCYNNLRAGALLKREWVPLRKFEQDQRVYGEIRGTQVISL